MIENPCIVNKVCENGLRFARFMYVSKLLKLFIRFFCQLDIVSAKFRGVYVLVHCVEECLTDHVHVTKKLNGLKRSSGLVA